MSRSVPLKPEASPVARTMLPELFTPAEVAAILRVTPRTIQRYANDGRLVRVKLGQRLSRYTAASVAALIEPDSES